MMIKAISIIIILNTWLLQACLGQSDIVNNYTRQPEIQVKHVSEAEFPRGNMLEHLETWGGMVVSVNEPKIGEAFSPVLKSLNNGLCEVPHWGYLEKGKIKVTTMDQTFEFISEGELFYIPAKHITEVLANARVIDFSPQHNVLGLLEDIDKVVTKD